MENKKHDLSELRVRCLSINLIKDLQIISKERNLSLNGYMKYKLKEIRDQEFKVLNIKEDS